MRPENSRRSLVARPKLHPMYTSIYIHTENQHLPLFHSPPLFLSSHLPTQLPKLTSQIPNRLIPLFKLTAPIHTPIRTKSIFKPTATHPSIMRMRRRCSNARILRESRKSHTISFLLFPSTNARRANFYEPTHRKSDPSVAAHSLHNSAQF